MNLSFILFWGLALPSIRKHIKLATKPAENNQWPRVTVLFYLQQKKEFDKQFKAMKFANLCSGVSAAPMKSTYAKRTLANQTQPGSCIAILVTTSFLPGENLLVVWCVFIYHKNRINKREFVLYF